MEPSSTDDENREIQISVIKNEVNHTQHYQWRVYIWSGTKMILSVFTIFVSATMMMNKSYFKFYRENTLEYDVFATLLFEISRKNC